MTDISQLTEFFRRAADYPSPTESLRNAFFNLKQGRDAAVLFAIICSERKWQLLLTRRATTLNKHTGEISLAGGSRDADDISLTQTALRETEEEIGIISSHWQTFPVLPPHHTPSGYTVYPVPALCTYCPNMQANPDEVAEIIHLPLNIALDTANYTTRIIHYQGKTLDTPALPYLHHDIWGLTAMILYSIAERYQAFCRENP